MKRTDRTPKKQHRESVAAVASAGPSAEARPRSRREFMRLMAVGASAMLAAPAAAAVKTAAKKPVADAGRMRRARTGEPAGPHPMLPAEIEKQKKFTADSLKTLRNYSLPPGSPPAYGFRPLAQKSRRGRS